MSDFNAAHNRVVWVDIPVRDLDRACRFYEGVLAIACHRESFNGLDFAVLDHKEGNGGCLVPASDSFGEPTHTAGPLVYFNVAGRIRDAVAKARGLGGTVTQDVHAIGPHGCRALLIDSEGNRLALHSPTDE